MTSASEVEESQKKQSNYYELCKMVNLWEQTGLQNLTVVQTSCYVPTGKCEYFPGVANHTGDLISTKSKISIAILDIKWSINPKNRKMASENPCKSRMIESMRGRDGRVEGEGERERERAATKAWQCRKSSPSRPSAV